MASLTVTSPSQGATWNSDQSHTISWTRSPLSGIWGSISIDLYKNNVFQETIAMNLNSNTSSYSWDIERNFTEGSDYMVTVSTSYTAGDP